MVSPVPHSTPNAPQPNGEAAIISVIPVALSCAPEEMGAWAQDALENAQQALAPRFGLLDMTRVPGTSAWQNPLCGPAPLPAYEWLAQRLGEGLSSQEEFRIHKTSSAVGADRTSHNLVEWAQRMGQHLRAACLRHRPADGLVVLTRFRHHNPLSDVAHVCVVYPEEAGGNTWATEPMSPQYLPSSLSGEKWQQHWSEAQAFDAIMDIFARTRIQSAWKPLLSALRFRVLDQHWDSGALVRTNRPRL